jgi:hypothetical protein
VLCLPTESRREAHDLAWAGTVALLEHEQRALVQPNFDRLSCMFARLVSLGCATSFEVRGVRHEAAYFNFVLPLLAHPTPPAGAANPILAADHPVRRPVGLAGVERGPSLPGGSTVTHD